MKIISMNDLPRGERHILSGIIPGDYLTAGGLNIKGPGDRSHDIGCSCKACDGNGRHVHENDHEVFIILQGKARIEVDGQPCVVSAFIEVPQTGAYICGPGYEDSSYNVMELDGKEVYRRNIGEAPARLSTVTSVTSSRTAKS